MEAVFAAGIALKSIDDLMRTAPPWAGCWRARQALSCAVSAVRLMGRSEDAAALRDAVLQTLDGDDPGPAGQVFSAFKSLSTRKPVFSSRLVEDLADRFGVSLGNDHTLVVDQAEDALQSARPAPFAATDFLTALHAARPDAEILSFALADSIIAAKLGWAQTLPLLMAERYGRAFRTIGGRGRVRPGEPGFLRAVCLALVDGTYTSLRSAGEIGRRAETLLAVAGKVRTKGAAPVIANLLADDAVAASAPGSSLSRWAATRLFERLEGFGAVRELSGRASFRLFGL